MLPWRKCHRGPGGRLWHPPQGRSPLAARPLLARQRAFSLSLVPAAGGVAMIDIKILPRPEGLARDLLKDKEASRQALKDTMSDLKKSAPTRVAESVVKRFNVAKGKVSPGKRNNGASSIRAGGTTIAEFSLEYKGRVLSPVSFGMKPKVRRKKLKSPYEISATILRSAGSKTIGHGGPPGSDGGRYARPSDSPYFLTRKGGPPMQRRGSKLYAMRTLSVPQMVGNEEVAEEALEQIGALMEKRLRHNIERRMK